MYKSNDYVTISGRDLICTSHGGQKEQFQVPVWIMNETTPYKLQQVIVVMYTALV